jgi:tetratricopeptide (TPR) repeat protein
LISNEESIVYYKKASAIDPLDISLKIHISTILESNGNITEAYTSILDCLQYSLMKHEENDLYARLSKLLYQYGCFNEALEYASRVLQSNPNNSEYLKLKNGILFELEGTINEPRLERTPCKSTMWNTQSEPCVIQIPEKSTLSQLSLILLKSFMKIYQIPEPSNADLSMWIKIEVSDGMDIDTEPSNSSEDSAALIPEVDSSIVEAICDDPIDLEHGNNNDSVNQVIVEGTIVQDDETDGKKRKLDARDKRSSIRVKQQQQIDNEQVVKERELECLTELNEILPQGKEFVEDGSVFLHPSVDTAKLLKQITHDIVLKSGSFVNRAKPKKFF